MLHKQSAFAADGIRHNDNGAVTADCAHQSKTDALIAAGGFHNDGIRSDDSAPLCVKNHVKGGSGLNGTANVESFVFNQNFCPVRITHFLQPDHRRVTDCFQHVVINHEGNHSFRSARFTVPNKTVCRCSAVKFYLTQYIPNRPKMQQNMTEKLRFNRAEGKLKSMGANCLQNHTAETYAFSSLLCKERSASRTASTTKAENVQSLP